MIDSIQYLAVFSNSIINRRAGCVEDGTDDTVVECGCRMVRLILLSLLHFGLFSRNDGC